MTVQNETIPTEGLHHITLVGASRKVSIDFWEGILGMPFIFEQPNLDDKKESHLYFDPGDGRLITVFTREDRTYNPKKRSNDVGSVHHLAFKVSQSTLSQVTTQLEDKNIDHSGVKDRGFMDSIYFRDPLGLLIELAYYKFTVPEGYRIADIMISAHRIRVCEGAENIDQVHVSKAIREITKRRDSLSNANN